MKPQLSGHTIDPQRVRQAKALLLDLLRTTRHQLLSGEDGWYRRIRKIDRVGVVATAQASLTLSTLGSTLDHPDRLIWTLVTRQAPDGSWSFVSNLDDRGVIDATAWVILALVRLRQLPEGAGAVVDNSVRNAATWLVGCANADGGWGICAGERTRPYSTAVAIRALAASGGDAQVVLRGQQCLVGLQDPASGAWADASGILSIPATANILLALQATATGERNFNDATDKAASWLLQIARSSQFWSTGPYARPREEVEAGPTSARRRVVFEASPRAVTLEALMRTGHESRPLVVQGFAEMLDAWVDRDWEQATGCRESEPTSWMLYDLGAALCSFEQAYPQRDQLIWVGRTQVVQHSPTEGRTRRLFRRHKRKGAFTSLGIAGLVGLHAVGIIESLSISALIGFVVGIGGDAISSMVSDKLKNVVERQ